MTGGLLEHLATRANSRGLVLVRERALCDELQLTAESLSHALASLERVGTLSILTSGPFLVIRLRLWSSSHPAVLAENAPTAPAAAGQKEVPVSSSAAAALQPREDGGAGEGEELLDQVLATLGPEAKREEFRAILLGHPPDLIRRALERVDATRQIRVSRAALFRALLNKL